MTEQEVGEPRLSLDSVATAEDDEERRIAAGQAYGDAFCSKNRDALRGLVVDDIHYSSVHETARGEQAAQKLWWNWQDVVEDGCLKVISVEALPKGNVGVKLVMGDLIAKDRLCLDDGYKVISVARTVGQDNRSCEYAEQLSLESEVLQQQLEASISATREKLEASAQKVKQMTAFVSALRADTGAGRTAQEADDFRRQAESYERLCKEVVAVREAQTSQDNIFAQLLRKKDTQYAFALSREEAHVAKLRRQNRDLQDEMDQLLAVFRENSENVTLQYNMRLHNTVDGFLKANSSSSAQAAREARAINDLRHDLDAEFQQVCQQQERKVNLIVEDKLGAGGAPAAAAAPPAGLGPPSLRSRGKDESTAKEIDALRTENEALRSRLLASKRALAYMERLCHAQRADLHAAGTQQEDQEQPPRPATGPATAIAATGAAAGTHPAPGGRATAALTRGNPAKYEINVPEYKDKAVACDLVAAPAPEGAGGACEEAAGLLGLLKNALRGVDGASSRDAATASLHRVADAEAEPVGDAGGLLFSMAAEEGIDSWQSKTAHPPTPPLPNPNPRGNPRRRAPSRQPKLLPQPHKGTGSRAGHPAAVPPPSLLKAGILLDALEIRTPESRAAMGAWLTLGTKATAATQTPSHNHHKDSQHGGNNSSSSSTHHAAATGNANSAASSRPQPLQRLGAAAAGGLARRPRPRQRGRMRVQTEPSVTFCYVCGAACGGGAAADAAEGEGWVGAPPRCRGCAYEDTGDHGLRRLLWMEKRAVRAKEVAGGGAAAVERRTRRKLETQQADEPCRGCLLEAIEAPPIAEGAQNLPPLQQSFANMFARAAPPRTCAAAPFDGRTAVSDRDRQVFAALLGRHGAVTLDLLRSLPVMAATVPNIPTAVAARETLHGTAFSDANNVTVDEFALFCTRLRTRLLNPT
ncbi:hypothetical protein DIPPA_24186 [Diplonema papillatum]|nr:hypothetical protein DIPPA_24186 [Diplonema papillatum]